MTTQWNTYSEWISTSLVQQIIGGLSAARLSMLRSVHTKHTRYGSCPFASQPHGSESDYQNVDFLTFINPEHVIYDIGTEIIMFHCFATKMLKSFCKSIFFSGIESSRRDLAFYSIKTWFKALWDFFSKKCMRRRICRYLSFFDVCPRRAIKLRRLQC